MEGASTFLSPVEVPLPGAAGGVTAVATATGSATLVATSGGQLYSFGFNPNGQLGKPLEETPEKRPHYTPALVTLPGATGPVVQVAEGKNFSLALTSTGQVFAFGSNLGGQLGTKEHVEEPTTPNPTPKLVTSIGLPVVQIAANEESSVALTAEGVVYTWGVNVDGQLGHPGGIGEPTAYWGPEKAGNFLPPIRQVAAGAQFDVALGTDGHIYTWGTNGQGNLGQGTKDKAGHPFQSTVSLPGASGTVVWVGAGVNDGYAITSTGQLYAWGGNEAGQIGNGATPKEEAIAGPTLISLPGATGPPVQASGGQQYSMALTSTGQLYTFGSGQYGRLGLGSEMFAATPTRVAFPVATTVGGFSTGPYATSGFAFVSNLSVVAAPLPERAVGAAYSASVKATGGALPYTWSASGLPPGLAIAAASGAISGTPTAGGSFPVQFTATDAHGIQATATLTIAISGGSPGKAGAPVVGGLEETAAKWKLGTKLAHLSRGSVRVGTKFSFTLNEAATVNLAFVQPAAGRRVKGSCVAPSARNRRSRTCTRSVTQGTLVLSGHAGRDVVSFQGRISRSRTLRPGAYTLVLTATNAAGQRSVPRTLHFTILR